MPIFSNPLERAIKQRTGMNLTFTLHNIRINGYQKGCSGFIRNNENGSVVYVDTEGTCIYPNQCLYRYADDEKDFHGYINHYVYSIEELADAICKFLQKTPQECREWRS